MAAEVFLLPVDPDEGAPIGPDGLRRLVAATGLSGSARVGQRWSLKLHVGPRGRAAAIDPAWASSIAVAAAGSAAAERITYCDTLSITTAGLDTVADHLELAARKGFGGGNGGPAYTVADDPAAGPSVRGAGVDGGLPLAALTAQATGLLVLTPVRPHPHLGFGGALHSLGVGLADREGKILLHRDLRPRVDTPLCAGCGSCIAVCLFDAIRIEAGRATIDHQRCTGCGECMNVCFMAGIAPEDAAQIPLFQERVAVAAQVALAGAAGAVRPAGFFNFLVRLDRSAGGPARLRDRLGDVGVLASRDPVALDQATWDLAAGGAAASLQSWSGFQQVPAPLITRAAALGLGTADYRLVTI